jgi:hypothetical protein
VIGGSPGATGSSTDKETSQDMLKQSGPQAEQTLSGEYALQSVKILL